MIGSRKSLFAGAVIMSTALPAAGDWPTLHRDYQRFGYTDEAIGEQFSVACQRKWYRSFVEERARYLDQPWCRADL
jgi:hypothetical protein